MTSIHRPTLIILLLGAWLGGWAYAAPTATFAVTVNVQEVAELAVTGNLAQPVALDNPSVGGANLSTVIDNTTYLQYTSTTASGRRRQLQASLSAPVPAAIILKLYAAPPSRATGQAGASTGYKTMTTTPTAIMTGIGGCATGTSAGRGAQLFYRLSVASWAQLVTTAITPTVTFTLTEDN